MRIGGRFDAVKLPTPRFGHPPQERREDEAGSRGQQEGKLPSLEPERRCAAGVQVVPPVSGHTAKHRGAAEAQGDRGSDHRRGKAALRLGVAVEHQREPGRLRGALADADAEARQGEQRKALRGPRQCRRQRPECQRDRQQSRSHPAVRQASQRQREQGVEEREHRAIQQSHLRIADVQVVLDPRGEDRKDVAVEQADRIRERDQGERVAGRVDERRAAHSLNQRSALVCISFFFADSGMSSVSWVRTSSAWNWYG